MPKVHTDTTPPKLIVLYGDDSPKHFKLFDAQTELEQAIEFARQHNQDNIYLIQHYWHVGQDGLEELPRSTPVAVR